MKTTWIIGMALAVALVLPTAGQAQFFDDFDSYANGSGIIGQGGWEGWNGDTGVDALVSDAQASTAPHSLAVSGGADVVQVFSGITSGTWFANVRAFVPTGQTGDLYFIILNQYSHGGTQNWSVQLRMSASEGIIESIGGSDFADGSTLPLITDQWVQIIVEIDLDANQYSVTYGGNTLTSGQGWTSTGLAEIQCIDLFSSLSSESYMDNVYLDSVVPVELQSFEIE